MGLLSRIKQKIKRTFFPEPKVIKVPVYIPVYENTLLNKRIALVTGGTGGIGLAIVKAFVKSGATVIFTGRSQERIDQVLSIDELKGNVKGIVLDNMNVESFSSKLQEITEKYGIPDILVNNAGLIKCNTFGNIEQENYDQIMATNLKGVVFLSQEISNLWKEKKIRGNILNICSSSGNRPGNSPYVLSKWGIKALTVGMARELIPYGITVNGLAPGPTATKMFTANGENGINWDYNPVKRLAAEEEMANLAVILTSDLCRMVVGDTLFATGGSAITTFDDIP